MRKFFRAPKTRKAWLRRWLSTKLHPSWPFYAAIVGFVVGISISVVTRIAWIGGLPWLLIALTLLIVSLFRPTKLLMPLAFLAGLIFAECRVSPELHAFTQWQSLVGQTVTITGTISEDPDFDSSGTALRLSNLQLHTKTTAIAKTTQATNLSDTTLLQGTLYVKLSGNHQDLLRSDQITLTGKLNSGFGTFVATMYRPTLADWQRADPGDLLAQFKIWFANLIREYLPSPQSDLGLGYLLGLKASLPDDLSDQLQAVGMTHVIVASGSHLGILVGTTRKLLGKFKLGKFAELFGGSLLILAFVCLVGFAPSMTRAGFVAALSLLVGYVGRKFTPVRLILLAAAFTLLLSPVDFLNLGWQLSFASFAGLLILAPQLLKFFYSGKTPPFLASTLLTSLATTICCAPVLIYGFGSLSLLSLVANLIILPTLPYAMLLVLLVGLTAACTTVALLAPLFHLLAQACSWLTILLLDFHLYVIELLSGQTMFILNFPTNQPLIFLLYLPILILIAALQRKTTKYDIIST